MTLAAPALARAMHDARQEAMSRLYPDTEPETYESLTPSSRSYLNLTAEILLDDTIAPMLEHPTDLTAAERESVAWLLVNGHYRNLPQAARERAVPVVEWVERRLASDRAKLLELKAIRDEWQEGDQGHYELLERLSRVLDGVR